MDFRVLGPIEVVHVGAPLDLGPRKQRSLLALLLVYANRVVTTDHILESLWGDDASGKENALWVYVARLRSILEPDRDPGVNTVLITRDHGYSLVVPPGKLDADRFADAVARAEPLVRSDPATAAAELREALAIWRGAAFEDFGYETFTQGEITRLEELRIHALEERVEADLRRGRAGDLIGELEALQREHPLRERPVGQLMRAMYQAGRQAEALRVFARFERYLGEELGTTPSPELHRLEEQILLHDAAVRGAATVPRGDAGARSNPFKGLRAFREEDAIDFFGRDAVVAEMVRRTAEGDTLIGLVGASGSGKSSIVRAGFVPALRKGAAGNPDEWLFAHMVPGAHPFAELEAALIRSSIDAPDTLRQQLQASDDSLGMLRAVMRILPEESSRLLLVIDQFEELFTLTGNEAVRTRFLDELVTALEDPRRRLVVALTLRADFYDRPLQHARFGSLLGSHIVNIVPMTPDELESAAVTPAGRQRVVFEPSLLATLLRDVVGQPGGLPLFQYTLTELFDRHVDGVLTTGSYEALGGVNGALSRRADDLYAGLSPAQQEVARQVFLRLVSIADSDEWSRRRVPASEILAIGADAVAIQAVIERFGGYRLLTFDRDKVTGAPTVEVAHEALLSEWPRLRTWIEAAREDIRRQTALTTAIREWEEADRDPGFLPTGSRLERYRAWAESSTIALTREQHAYLDAAVERRKDAEQTEQARIAAEQKVERSAKRRLWALAAAVVVLLGAGLTALLAALAPEPPTIALIGYRRGLDRYSEQIINGFEQARIDRADEAFDAIQLYPVSDGPEELGELLDRNPDLVFVNTFAFAGGLFGETLLTVTDRYPETVFVGLDWLGFEAPNGVQVAYAAHEGSFLVGAAAAMESDTGIIGFVGGTPWSIDWFRAGFEAGARYVRPDIEVVSRYALGNSEVVFRDPQLVQDAAAALYARGADVVYSATGEAGAGTLVAATEDSGRHLWTIGVDVDEWLYVDATDRGHVLTSMLLRRDNAVRHVVTSFLDDQLIVGSQLDLGIVEGAVDYSTSGDHLSDTTIDRLDELKAAIIRGDIDVPLIPTGPATDSPAPDLTERVTISDEMCEVPQVNPEVGDIVQLDFVNDASRPEGVAVWRLQHGTTAEDVARNGIAMYDQYPEWQMRYTLVGTRPGGEHAATIEIFEPGVWAVTCSTFTDHRLAGLFVVEP